MNRRWRVNAGCTIARRSSMRGPRLQSVLAALWVAAAAGRFVMAAETASTAPHAPFLAAAAQSGMMQVEAARTAVATSGNTAVKEFAYRLIHDYEKMNADLAAIAQKLGISLPAELDAQHAAVFESLRATPAQSFDVKYLTQVMEDQENSASLLQSNLLNSNTELAVYSSYNLPGTRARKALAWELKAALAR
jgi:putative membrane protein